MLPRQPNGRRRRCAAPAAAAPQAHLGTPAPQAHLGTPPACLPAHLPVPTAHEAELLRQLDVLTVNISPACMQLSGKEKQLVQKTLNDLSFGLPVIVETTEMTVSRRAIWQQQPYSSAPPWPLDTTPHPSCWHARGRAHHPAGLLQLRVAPPRGQSRAVHALRQRTSSINYFRKKKQICASSRSGPP